MKRFRQFLAKTLDLDAIKNEDRLSKWGISVRYAPDPPDDFDEFEFGLNYKGNQDVAFLVAIEKWQDCKDAFWKDNKGQP